MDNDGNKIIWTVVIISAIAIIGLMFVNFMPSQTANIKAAIGNELSSFGNDHTSDNSSSKSSSSSSSSSSHTTVGPNLLIGTSNVLTTVPNVTYWSTGLPWYHPEETLKANQTYTLSCYLEPAEHDAAICISIAPSAQYYNGHIFGTTIAAGSKGLSTLTITLTPEDVEAFKTGGCWITFTNYQNNKSAVSYKGFKLEKGSVATPWCPNPADHIVSD